ncbi:MAG: 3-hydroxyacyl-ACP dehydratase FabZ [Spirochaetaceae bacterium]|nr:3-hydroxyacyl-ACP dehydratase FabZ [Spirochaetaceae bacterium]
MKNIEKLIPHRPPFMFVDSVRVEGEEIVATYAFSPEEWFFKGHFPDYPVVPGVLLIESMAQAGGAGAKLLGVTPDGLFVLAKIRSASFRRQVRPGELFEMQIRCLHSGSHILHQSGKGLVDGEIAVEAEWIAMTTDRGSVQGGKSE